jgi:Double zinc ribbon
MKCPFCQHENISGTRFCAECGFSMHLKICPNPQCGKISDVGVAVCEHCGQAFPKLAAAPDTASVAPAASPAPGNVPEKAAGATRDNPRTAAWPLIMVAVVAGGLPLLWANRASLPTPKTWQVSTQDATKVEGAAPAPIGKMKPPVVPELAPAPTSAPTQAPTQVPSQGSADSAVSSSAAPAQAPAAGNGDQGSPKPDPADNGKKDPAASQQSGDSTKEIAKKVARTPTPKKQDARPCTEATAALGLCDPKRPGQ